jgi:hypothetical protein
MRRRVTFRQLASICGVLCAVLCTSSAPVLAGQGGLQGYGSVSGGTINAGASSSSAGNPGSEAGSSGGTSSSPAQACPYIPAPPNIAAYLGPGSTPQGAWYVLSCSLPVSMTGTYSPIWVPSTPTHAPTASVPGLLQQAFDQAALLHTVINLNPPGEQVVNVPSWLWIAPNDWSSVVAHAAAGNVTATVTAKPISVVWNLGDGNSVTCSGPGTPYDPSKPADAQSTDCSYTWRTSSVNQPQGVYVVTATIEYDVTTVVTGAPDPTPNLGVHPGPAAQAEVPVSEVEALGTNP